MASPLKSQSLSKSLEELETIEVTAEKASSETAPRAIAESLNQEVGQMVKDRPWIRQAAWLYAKGHSREEIAEACGVNPYAISLVLGTPGFRKLASEFMLASGSQAGVQKQITRASMEAFMNIMFLANSAQSEQVRLKANQDILDRALGRAPQIVRNVDENKPVDPLEEARQLDQQILEGARAFQQEGLLIDKTLKEQ